MDFKEYKALIDRIERYARSLDLWHFGEPLLHSQIDEMIEYAAKKKISVRVSTNATLLGGAVFLLQCGLDTIIVSLDGASRKSHEIYRKGSSFEEVMSAISEFCRKKRILKARRPRIVLQMLATAFNEGEKVKFIELAKELGVDRIRLKTLSLGSWRTDEERIGLAGRWLPKDSKLTRYSWHGGKIALKSIDPCRWIRRNGVVLWNGDLTVCCYDFDGVHAFANVFERDYVAILKSDEMKSLRERMASRRLPLCNNCQNLKDIYVFDLPIES